MKNTMLKNTLILTCITLASGLLLGLVYEVTKAPIATAKETAKQAAYQEVFHDAKSFSALESFDAVAAETVLADAGLDGNTIQEVVVANNGSEDIGYVVTVVSHDGYAGDITFTMGVTNEGLLNAISILTINETAGLGMKANEAEFKNQFAEKQVEAFTVTKVGAKDETEINAISGATITSSAVTNGVNAGIAYVNTITGGGANE